jgi:hypothetical protein
MRFDAQSQDVNPMDLGCRWCCVSLRRGTAFSILGEVACVAVCTAIEAENELVEIGLKVFLAKAVVDAERPGFHVREKVRGEWGLVTMAWNMSRMYVLNPA